MLTERRTGYVTYVVTPEELEQARVLYESVRVFDSNTPFYFVSPDTSRLSFRRLTDFYDPSRFKVLQVPWPEAGIPYRSMWQLPHLLEEIDLGIFLAPNVVLNRDLSWLFTLFEKYCEQLRASIGFSVMGSEGRLQPWAFMFDRRLPATWRFFEAVRDVKEASSWHEAALYLVGSWQEISGLSGEETSPAMPLFPLRLQAVSAERVSGRPPHLLVDGLPVVENLFVHARTQRQRLEIA